jgi:hypothetical protein
LHNISIDELLRKIDSENHQEIADKLIEKGKYWAVADNLDKFQGLDKEIAKQFAEENNLEGVYLSEHLGGWHADSNRQEVRNYLAKLRNTLTTIQFKFAITDEQNIQSMSKIK